MSSGDVSHDAPASHDSGESQASGSVNKKRRYFLIKATSAVAAVGAVGVAVPFLQYWSPSARAKALGAPVTVDISKLKPGEMLVAPWRGKPVFLLNRDDATLAALETGIGNLADPDSENGEMQPEFAVNAHRSSSKRPEIGVFMGICTHLGCSPKHVVSDNFPGSGDSQGGFFCPCHGSRFDLAGRVVAGFPAPDNLEVPPYRYESDSVIVIGETEGAA